MALRGERFEDTSDGGAFELVCETGVSPPMMIEGSYSTGKTWFYTFLVTVDSKPAGARSSFVKPISSLIRDAFFISSFTLSMRSYSMASCPTSAAFFSILDR